jgi:cell division protein FtsW
VLSLRLPRPVGGRTARTAAAGPVREFDLPLLWASVVLLLFGMVMVYSASIALPDSARFASLRTTHHLTRHAFALTVGFGCALFAFAIRSHGGRSSRPGCSPPAWCCW